jgi:hypothetical protein
VGQRKGEEWNGMEKEKWGMKEMERTRRRKLIEWRF